jgi:hypothetical protein
MSRNIYTTLYTFPQPADGLTGVPDEPAIIVRRIIAGGGAHTLVRTAAPIIRIEFAAEPDTLSSCAG